MNAYERDQAAKAAEETPVDLETFQDMTYQVYSDLMLALGEEADPVGCIQAAATTMAAFHAEDVARKTAATQPPVLMPDGYYCRTHDLFPTVYRVVALMAVDTDEGLEWRAAYMGDGGVLKPVPRTAGVPEKCNAVERDLLLTDVKTDAEFHENYITDTAEVLDRAGVDGIDRREYRDGLAEYGGPDELRFERAIVEEAGGVVHNGRIYARKHLTEEAGR